MKTNFQPTKIRIPGEAPFIFITLVVLLTIIVGACQLTPAEVDTSKLNQPTSTETAVPVPISIEKLYENSWVLIGFGDPDKPTVLYKNTLVTAIFTADGLLTGTSACNQYQTLFEVDDTGMMKINPEIITTRMLCPEDDMQIEQAYLQALIKTQTFSFTIDGNLEISYPDAMGNSSKLYFAPGSVPLTGTTWSLISYGAPEALQTLPEGIIITANFSDDGVLSGSAGCNTYSTIYSTLEDQIFLQPIATTMMYCETGMEQEQAYLNLLESAQTYQLIGKNLFIYTTDGQELIFSSINLPLEGTLWNLVTLNGQSISESTSITLALKPNPAKEEYFAGGSAGCNNYSGGYTLQDNSITFSELATTMMMCEEPIMQQEQTYLAFLSMVQTYQILGNHLMLSSDAGEATFVASRTPLTGALWSLRTLGSLDDPQVPVPGSLFTAQFTSFPGAPTGVLSGTTGCNEYASSYVAGVNNIKINLPQSTGNTSCVPGLTDQEMAYFLALHSATEFNILGNTLVIPYDAGKQVLIFDGAPFELTGKKTLDEINDTSWYLWTINETPIANGTTITADFSVNPDGESGTINGSAGCNLYQATFGTGLGVQTTLNSQELCTQPQGISEQEKTYMNSLSRAYGYWLTGDQLILNTGEGALTYKQSIPPQSLDQTHLLQATDWFLVSYNTSMSAPGANGDPTLIFKTDGNFSGYTGCNTLQGRYVTNINQINFTDMTMTKAACPNSNLAAQENAIINVLNSAQTYQVFESNLQLVGANGVLYYYFAPVNRPEDFKPPVAVIKAPSQAQVGEVVVFDASQSVGQVALTSYQWDFGDGGRGSSAIVEHVYQKPGKYYVQMTVTDARGYRDSESLYIDILSLPTPTPVPTQPVSTPTQPPATATQSAPTATQPAATVTQPASTATQHTVTATQPEPTAAQPTATATQTAPTPEPTLEPTQTQEPTPTPEPTAEPAPVPPQANISGSTSGYPGEPVTFDAQGSVAGSSPISSYLWNFGDGTESGPSNTPTIAKIFNQAGTYDVTVVVTDENGLSSSATMQVQIKARLDTAVWLLTNLGGQPLVPGTNVTLQFLSGEFAGFSGCNSYTGNYAVEQNAEGAYVITIQSLSSTKQVCPDTIMQQENMYLSQIVMVTAARIENNLLILSYPEGELTYYQTGSPMPK
jgi:heat shock protein HslJ